MPLQKQVLNMNFAQGLDTKTDPYQVQMGKFLAMQNSVFTTAGRLTKRNGFALKTTNPVHSTNTSITTLNDNLVTTGNNLYSYSEDTNQWLFRGTTQPIQLSVQAAVRTSHSQSVIDSAVASNGLICVTYIDSNIAYFQINDSKSGQQVRQITSIVSIDTSASAIHAPRVSLLGNYFIVTYIATIGGTPELKYIAIPISNPNATLGAALISSTVHGTSAGYDILSFNNILYVAWASSSSAMKMTVINTSFVVGSPITLSSSHSATLVSIAVDNTIPTAPVIWFSYYDSNTSNGYSAAFDITLTVTILAETLFITATSLEALTSVALNAQLQLFYQETNTYASPYPTSGIRSDYITAAILSQGGTLISATAILRSVGLGSKAFIDIESGYIYMLAAYGDTNQSSAANNSNQPTYFLIDSSGNIYMRLAYSNGGGYPSQNGQVLPTVVQYNGSYYVAYLFADLLASVNKGTNLPSGTPTAGIYTQYGVNIAQIGINNNQQYSAEIAGSLHLTGGQLWQYDGAKAVEHGFHVWPENCQVANTSSMAGSIGAGTYFYQFTYEWTDANGELHRSAPSIPISVTVSGSTNTNTLYVPTLRLTYKTGPDPVRIVGYRWSSNQQVYYQFTSITSPTVNDTTVDFVSITDTFSDAQILGNVLLYTTGGVIENIAAPASIHSTLFNNRLFLIDAEDRNLLWYSKQVIENTPVEMSDLLTIYVAPTTGAQKSTGPMTALSAMDDKLIIFKEDAIYYINGIGPDNTGANSTYSDPVFITGTVGCANPNSIILMPNGIMFQSDKGIWLLGRDLSTSYIGAPVEAYNSFTVESANTIPGTNQVRFIINNQITLMYDYFFNQWGTFSNINAISATLWQGLHTYINGSGQVYQETQGTYTDGSTPVLMSLTSAWINVAGLQGFERFYQLLFLGTYQTPFKLNVLMGFNYNPSPVQNVLIMPNNYAASWGGEANWGSGQDWGGSDAGPVFRARVFPNVQKCESFQISIQEVYDSSLGVAPGQGLSLSGMAIVAGSKRGFRTQSASKSFG